MATERVVIPGIVKNGLVVPQSDTPLPDGAHVDILLGPADVPPALQAEFVQWEKASDEAWDMIDKWETEEPFLSFTIVLRTAPVPKGRSSAESGSVGS